jgi:hypothetical protein
MSSSMPAGKLPDDTFRAQLREALARIRAWAASVAEAAHIETSETDSYWRLKAEPAAEHACAFELIVHHDQHFDLLVDPETYEECPIGDVHMLELIVEAIGDGRVTTRSHVSRNTGAVRSVETIIALSNGGDWRGHRLNEPLASVIRAEDCEAQDRCYVPYRLRGPDAT